MLRKNWEATGLVPQAGPPQRSTCSASPASWCSPPRCTQLFRALEHGDDLDSPTASRVRTTADGRLLRRRPPPARDRLCSAARFRPRAGEARGGDRRWARRRCWSRRAARRPLAEPHRARSGLGAWRRRRASRSCSMSAAAARCSTRTTSRTACPPVTDFHGGDGELPLDRLHGDPAIRRCRRWRR